MIHLLIVLFVAYNISSYLSVKVAYVAEDGVTSDSADTGTYRKPWRQVVSAISFASRTEPDLLKVLVKRGNYTVATNGSFSVTSKTDFEIIGSVPGEIVTERSKMEDGLTEDTTFDLDCVNTALSFYEKGEFTTITNNQTFSMRRMRISSNITASTIFRVKLGHLIGRKIYFSGEGRKIVIEYIHGSVSLFYCYFGGGKPGYGDITVPNGAGNVFLQQCRFNNTLTDVDELSPLSPLYFNNATNITLQSCVFHNLSALHPASHGGAIHIISPNRVSLIGCSFDTCTSTLNGGGMMISNINCADASFFIVSCVFISNVAKSLWGHQICFHYEWEMCPPTMSGMFKRTNEPVGIQIYALHNLGGESQDYLLSHNENVGPYLTSVNPDYYCNTVDYIDPGVKVPPKPPPRPVDQQTAEASKHLSRILLIFLIIITVVVIIIGVLVCIYLVVTMIQGLSKPARVKEKELNETEAEAYYNQIDGYEIEQVAHDEDGVTIIGEEERVQKGGSKWAKKWAAIAKRAKKKNKFGVEDVPDDPDGPNPDDLASDVSVTKNTQKRSMKKDKSGWSTGYSEYDGYGSQSYSGYGASGYGYSGYSGSNASNGGYSGYSGSDASGYSGSGASGYSGSGASGYSGYSGSGASGYSGSGASGYSGSGASGYSGSDASGYSGSGASGYSGSGTSGYSGSGASGYSGSNPPSGYSNTNPSGYSGAGGSGYTDAGYSGSGASGYSDASGSGASRSGVYSDYSNASGAGASGYSNASKASSKSKRSSSSHRSDAQSKKSKASKATKSHK